MFIYPNLLKTLANVPKNPVTVCSNVCSIPDAPATTAFTAEPANDCAVFPTKPTACVVTFFTGNIHH